MIAPFITYGPWRRVEWKGHENREGVRRTIEYARRNSRPLRVFKDRDLPEYGTDYTEILPEYWDEMFFGDR